MFEISHEFARNRFFWLYRKGKYKECGSGFQPRFQMPRLPRLKNSGMQAQAASPKI